MREAFVQYAEWVLRVATILAVAPPQTFKCTINISDFFCRDGYGYLLQITLRDEATSSVQDVILTNKEANDAMKVLEEKWSNLVKYKHERQ